MTIFQSIRYAVASAIYKIATAAAPKDSTSNVVGPWPPGGK